MTEPRPTHRQPEPSDENHETAQESETPANGTHQIEVLLNKGLDLTEAGIGLGVNIVARLGTIFKDQVIEKLGGSEILGSMLAPSPTDYPPQQPAPPPQAEESAPPAGGQEMTYLFNRLTLHPGDPISLSFSINNDSLDQPKKIRISVENFVGEAQKVVIDAGLFSVTPSRKTIAPVDFEKFILKGKIPEETPEDTYHGELIVLEAQKYRIPVILIVVNVQA